MKFEGIKTWGWENAIIGMRLPMSLNYEDAKEKSDSKWCDVRDCRVEKCAGCSCYENSKCKYNTEKEHSNIEVKYCIGKDDLRIAQNLVKADSSGRTGSPNSKFLRMIHCQICVTAPMYWWAEADTYKVGTVRNSSSKMHKLASTPITMDCFEMDDFENVKYEEFETGVTTESGIIEIEAFDVYYAWQNLIDTCEKLRMRYLQTKDKRYWKELIRLLPESWLQTSVLDLNYETLRNIYSWRKNHKLTEWHQFCKVIEELPLAKELIVGDTNESN